MTPSRRSSALSAVGRPIRRWSRCRSATRSRGWPTGAIEISPAGSDTLADARDPEGRQSAGGADRRRRDARGRLRPARDGLRPGAQRGVDDAAARRAADGGDAAVANPIGDAGGRRASERSARTVTRHGKRKTRPHARDRAAAGERRARSVAASRSAGGCTNRDGQGIAGAEVQVLSRSAVAPSSSSAVVHTDGSRQLHVHRGGQHKPHPAVRVCRVGVDPARPSGGPPAGPGGELAASEPPARAQRAAR